MHSIFHVNSLHVLHQSAVTSQELVFHKYAIAGNVLEMNLELHITYLAPTRLLASS